VKVAQWLSRQEAIGEALDLGQLSNMRHLFRSESERGVRAASHFLHQQRMILGLSIPFVAFLVSTTNWASCTIR
jgi:hypothetical protein